MRAPGAAIRREGFRLTSPTSPSDAPRPASSSVLVTMGVVLALGAAGAWFAFGRSSEPVAEDARPAPSGKPGTSFVPATRLDAARASLVGEPTGMRLEVVLSGTAPGETFHARLRDTRQDPRRPTVFVDRGAPRTEVGRLETTATETGTAGEVRLTVRIAQAVDAVTVIDLRASGRWEGLEVEASAPR